MSLKELELSLIVLSSHKFEMEYCGASLVPGEKSERSSTNQFVNLIESRLHQALKILELLFELI